VKFKSWGLFEKRNFSFQSPMTTPTRAWRRVDYAQAKKQTGAKNLRIEKNETTMAAAILILALSSLSF
jgi:hypothetical protein